jgi:hypothetical protein
MKELDYEIRCNVRASSPEQAIERMIDRLNAGGEPDAIIADGYDSRTAPQAAQSREQKIGSLIDAARDVINNWEHGDLAASVRELEFALNDLGYTRDTEEQSNG